MSESIKDIELWAWLGEDEFGTGEIGIKQAQVPAGIVPMVAVRRDRMEKYFHHAEAQAKRYGKKIRLCRFKFVEVVRETECGQ